MRILSLKREREKKPLIINHSSSLCSYKDMHKDTLAVTHSFIKNDYTSSLPLLNGWKVWEKDEGKGQQESKNIKAYDCHIVWTEQVQIFSFHKQCRENALYMDTDVIALQLLRYKRSDKDDAMFRCSFSEIALERWHVFLGASRGDGHWIFDGCSGCVP